MKVCVAGGGIAGLATAWALTKRGHEVTLIEQGPIPNPLAASGDEHRMIRRGYSSVDGYARIISEAFSAWDEMWRDLGRSHLSNRGVLAMSQLEGDDGEKFREGYDRMGEAYDLYKPKEAARRYPFLDANSIRYAYHTKAGGALLCQRIASDLAHWLQEKGTSLRLNTRVDSIDAEAGTVRLADGSHLRADRIIVAACSGHGYKFGAAVGRRVATAVETGDDAALLAWLRAEV